MFNIFICGSFQNQEKEDTLNSLCSTPKRSRRSGHSYKNKQNKNRFSNIGLDKFNALLSELEEKKQEIYTQKGAEDIALVQFDISSDNEIKPIIVKVKGKRPSDASSTTSSSSKTTHDNITRVSEQLKNHAENHENSSNKKMEVEEIPKKKRGRASSHFIKFENFKQPFYYLPVVVILILLFLAIYGRPFAILCTSIGWYLIPLLRGGKRKSSSNNINNKRKLKRKKEHSTRLLLSENIFDGSSSPTSVFNGPAGVSPQRYDRRTEKLVNI